MIDGVLATAIASLASIGVSAVIDRAHVGDGVTGLTVDLGGRSTTFTVLVRQRAPYPNELIGLEKRRSELAGYGYPVLLTNFVSGSLGERLRAEGWSFIDTRGNIELRAPGLIVSRRESDTPSRRQSGGRSRRSAPAAALLRLAIGWPNDSPLPSVTNLATRVGVSQPRVSQILRALADDGLVRKVGRSWHVNDRSALLERYLVGDFEVRRTTTRLYSLDEPHAVVDRALRIDPGVVVSADVGADLVAPWKVPAAVVLYTNAPLSTHDLDVVEADLFGAANVVVREVGRHRDVWQLELTRSRYGRRDVRIADPALLMRDLVELGGDDREEAAGVLRSWILDQP